MHYLVISFSHKSCEIAVREKLALEDEDKKLQLLKRFSDYASINESIVLSTCNRVELIFSTSRPGDATEYALETMSSVSGVWLQTVQSRAEIYEDEGAIHHLFSVMSSLDSLVVGESQITGQLKDAYRFAYDTGYCGPKLARVMHFAFKCAAQVRSATSISKNRVSISSVAVEMAQDKAGDLSGKNALVVGAGEMSTHAIRNLLKKGAHVKVLARDFNKTKTFAKSFEAGVVPCRSYELQALLQRSELVFSATSSSAPVIRQAMLQPVSFTRYLFDIAVPSDIEEIQMQGVYVYKVDDLKQIVAKNVSQRQQYAKQAYQIVSSYTTRFFQWLEELSVEPFIKQLRLKADKAVEDELNRCIGKGYLPKELEANIKKAMQSSFNRFLHDPTRYLRAASKEGKTESMLESLQCFFELKDLDGEKSDARCALTQNSETTKDKQ
ncbi:MAG: glutamyl-tRNA reductase [Campylobacterota bacterium]